MARYRVTEPTYIGDILYPAGSIVEYDPPKGSKHPSHKGTPAAEDTKVGANLEPVRERVEMKSVEQPEG